MSHLRIVGNEPPKPRRRKGRRFSAELIAGDEQKRAQQALRNLRDAFGTWPCLAAAMNVSTNSIRIALSRNRVTPAMLYAASKASGLSISELLGGPVAADRCRACGRVRAA